MLGHSPLAGAPIGGSLREIIATFDVATRTDGFSIVQTVSFFERALIERLHKFPDDIRVIDRRKFEELIAELWHGLGYEVELTKQTRDGGKDVIAIKQSLVRTRYIIECKRPNPGNPVRLSTVKELRATKSDDPASKAILVTTTHFTKDAKAFEERHPWDLELHDFDSVYAWIAMYLKTASQ